MGDFYGMQIFLNKCYKKDSLKSCNKYKKLKMNKSIH